MSKKISTDKNDIPLLGDIVSDKALITGLIIVRD